MTNAWDEIADRINVCEIKAIVIRLVDYKEKYGETSLSCSIENFQDHLDCCPIQGMHIPTSGPAYNLRKKLNVEYDSGYGGQQLFGTIWMVDGTWWTRGEYDGSEWWQHHECPEYDPERHATDY